MRRKPDSLCGARTDPGIRRRQDAPGAIGQAGVRPQGRRQASRTRPFRAAPVKLAGPGVFDDFPQIIPVSQRELEVIETYLNDLLDGVLGRPE